MKALTLSFLALLLLAGSACTRVSVSVHQSSHGNELTGTNCKLQRVLRNQAQKTDYWCWAASAHTVIEYLKDEPIDQRDLVDAVFRVELEDLWNQEPPNVKKLSPPTCHMSTAEFEAPINQRNVDIARAICRTTGWPEYVFNTEKFHMYFELYRYDPTSDDPQGLSWDEIVAEICADRPMISAIHFSRERGGGTHTVVIGGYNELEDGSQWVHVYDPGYNTLEEDYYLWPYDVYLGDPGVLTHVRDYKNISQP